MTKDNRTIKERLPEILKAHRKYLLGDKDGIRADLSGCDLSDCDLRGRDLRRCNFRGCDLSGCNLSDYNFRGCDLSDCDLRDCDLSDCDLSDCDLRGSDLRDCDLSDCDLSGSDFRDCDMRGCDLRDCNLRGCDMRGCDLRDCDLRGCVGFYPLTQTESGHMVGAYWHDDHWRIKAGCRDFTVSEARKHLGSPDYHSPSDGSRILCNLDWLEKQPTPKEYVKDGAS